jgi:hypothetical protein
MFFGKNGSDSGHNHARIIDLDVLKLEMVAATN